MKKILTLFAAILLAGVFCFAQRVDGKYNESIDLRLDHFDGQYAAGEKVQVKASFAPGFEGRVRVEVIENGNPAGKKFIPAQDGVVFEKSYDAPTLVFVTVSPEADEKDATSIGFIVDGEHFEPGFPCPKDLNKFWARQIKALRKVPMKAEAKPVDLPKRDAEKYECFDIRINSIDETPCIGYLVKPRDAAPKSLPIVIYTHGAGVNKTSNRSSISTALRFAKMGDGAIAIDLNALGMENAQPQAYYDSLAAGPLYRYSSRPFVDHESVLFRTMFLRLVRTLDYLTQDPAWDGERVLMWGSSQGGAQSAAIAGMDPRVKVAVIIVPAMMDMGGELAGHNKAWCYTMDKQPESAIKIAPYYDTANLIRNFKGTLWVECGLIDRTCPASCVFAGYNKATCEKSIHTYPYRPHGEPTGRYRTAWVDQILSKRNDFINEYLSAKK